MTGLPNMCSAADTSKVTENSMKALQKSRSCGASSRWSERLHIYALIHRVILNHERNTNCQDTMMQAYGLFAVIRVVCEI